MCAARLSLLSNSMGTQQSPIRRLFLGRSRNFHYNGNRISEQHQYRSSRSTTTSSMDYVVDPPRITSLPVVGTNSRFPVRRVYCVGKNYAAHVVEMGGDLERSNPVFFTKPSFNGVVYAGSSAFRGGSDGSDSGTTSTSVNYPPNTSNLHYEVELVVAIGKGIDNNSFSTATHPPASTIDLLDCVYGYAVGIDLTRRDLQGEAKSKGLPWDTGKYFDESAPMGPITPAATTTTSFEDILDEKTMELTVNGETRQSVRLENMIWKVPEIITELSKSFELKQGDLIMTGTPSGVGPIVAGDRLVGTIDGLVEKVDITLI